MNESHEVYKQRLIDALFYHRGEANALDMGELYRIVYREEYNNKISDTRSLRRLITFLRFNGYPIGSTSRKKGGGYFWATGMELDNWKRRVEKSALKKLSMIQKMKKTIRELSGQQRLNLEQ